MGAMVSMLTTDGVLPAPMKTPIGDEVAFVEEMVRRLVEDFPPRRTMTPAERAAQAWVARELESLDLSVTGEPFAFNDNLYAVLALHFGLATAGAVVAGRLPRAGAALQALGGGSYWLDSTKRAEVLRRVFPYGASQNLLARVPARSGTPRLRLVYLAHIDAAYTGLLFHPRFIKTFTHKGTTAPYTARSLELATHAALAGAAVAGLRSLLGRGPRTAGVRRAIRRAEYAIAIPSLISFLLNFDVVRRDTIVPGAADNLTGVAAALLLAERLRHDPHPDVEHVFVITGAEEAGTGGARRLATAHRQEWSTADTVIIGLDTLSNGDLFWTEEGEQGIKPHAPWLAGVLARTAEDPRFADVGRYQVPVGSTDVAPFLTAGYDGVTLACVDLQQGSPRHYHYVTDTPENTDPTMVVHAVDFAEALVGNIVATRLG